MASLSLSPPELKWVRSSWGDVMAANNYKTNIITATLFERVIRNNKDVRAALEHPDIRTQQEVLFGELLTFTMMYLHNVPVLDECTDEFVKENPAVIKYGVQYLEPMGGVLIQYMRDTLGREKFHPGLETLWIKVYIYIANCILQNDDESDVDSLIDEEPVKCSDSEEDDEVEPLNLPPRNAARVSAASSIKDFGEVTNKPQPEPVPFKSSPLPRLEDKSSSDTIKIDLGRNEKYRGFRRSVTESPKEPVQVKVPATFISPKQILSQVSPRSPVLSPRAGSPVSSESASFDPRAAKRRSSNDSPSLRSLIAEENTSPLAAPKPAKQSPPLWMREQSPESSASSSDMEVTAKTRFDPRRNSFHRRTPSESSNEYSATERKLSGSSCESPVSDCDDELNLASSSADDQIDFSAGFRTRQNQVFDSNSFGIKGLAPIAETDGDDSSECSDNASSNYGSNSKSTEDESSSRASSLSLHNLDYKSSISSGLANSPDMAKHSHAPKMSHASDISFMAALAAPNNNNNNNPYRLNNKYASSTPSLSTRSLYSSGKSASLGFMRSSFVLKKEMETLGYNHPENVSLQGDVPPRAAAPPSLARITTSQSSTSLPLHRVQLHQLRPREPVARMRPATAPQTHSSFSRSQAPSVSDVPSKKSFMQKLGSIFGSSSSLLSSSLNSLVSSYKNEPKVGGKNILSPINLPPIEKPAYASSHSAKKIPRARRDSSASFASYSSSCYDVSAPTDLTNRVSSSDFRKLKPQPPIGYAASVYLKPSASDNASIFSSSSKSSRFSSFLKSKSKLRSETMEAEKLKKNKYNVKKLPYKVIHVKDFVR